MHSDLLSAVATESASRNELWGRFVRLIMARRVVEIGVYRGAFALHLLETCPCIETYYMIDPWRHLENWNKPANRDDAVFQHMFEQVMGDTARYQDKRVVLRGSAAEVIDRIPDSSLDFAYVDGDHTLRGITIDLLRVYPKVKTGGWIAGDDFSRSIWQHGRKYEPTFVFPFAVYFAEAVGARIYALRKRQFLIEKPPDDRFEFLDLTGKYAQFDLRRQLSLPESATSEHRSSTGVLSGARRIARRTRARLRLGRP